MSNKGFIALLVAASIFIITGFIFSFINLEAVAIINENSEYVSALFSLSGVILFFAALLYQIKEYKLQVIELRKSVEAQTKSSEALDDQKKILLEQNINNILFGMIDGFNLFKERNDYQTIVNKWYDECYSILMIRWQELSKSPYIDNSEFNILFAKDTKEWISGLLVNFEKHYELKKYVQFAYNVLYLIDENLSNITRNIFTPFFLSQLNSKEIALIYFSNLVDSGMPRYPNLKWDYHTTSEIFNIINNRTKPNNLQSLDFNILTQEFNTLKQH